MRVLRALANLALLLTMSLWMLPLMCWSALFEGNPPERRQAISWLTGKDWLWQ